VRVTGDYDGDGKTDYAVWRPTTGVWYVILSSNPGSPLHVDLGSSGDVPVPGDYDGDGKTGCAIWRPSEGAWIILFSSGIRLNSKCIGTSSGPFQSLVTTTVTERPISPSGSPGTGVGTSSPVSRPGTVIAKQWGRLGDTPVPGDYDGDGRADYAVWRESSGTWFVIPSGSPAAPIAAQWGLPGDIPVAADYDGDGKTDFAVWRAKSGTWYLIPSSNPTAPDWVQWGAPGDIPR
jgi:hypothetical protein